MQRHNSGRSVEGEIGEKGRKEVNRRGIDLIEKIVQEGRWKLKKHYLTTFPLPGRDTERKMEFCQCQNTASR